MALDALSSNDFLKFVIYDTIQAAPCSFIDTSSSGFLVENSLNPLEVVSHSRTSLIMSPQKCQEQEEEGSNCKGKSSNKRQNQQGVQGKKKRRRKTRVCKNKQEAENQRMTHIIVERNRRKQMNEHLTVLRSLMPESYVQRGDQASIVGGAIEFVKKLEQLLQSLEAKKLQLLQDIKGPIIEENSSPTINTSNSPLTPPPSSSSSSFAQFFMYPSQFTCPQISNKYTSTTQAPIADIEVTLIETHANLRILTRKSHTQLSKLVSGFQSLCLTILHINVTTIHPLVLYSISAKVEEGCKMSSVDEIAGSVHHMLRIIEEEDLLLCLPSHNNNTT